MKLTHTNKKFELNIDQDYQYELQQQFESQQQVAYIAYFYKNNKITNVSQPFYINGKIVKPVLTERYIQDQNNQVIVPIQINLNKGYNYLDFETMIQADTCQIVLGYIYSSKQIFNQIFKNQQFSSNKIVLATIKKDPRFSQFLIKIFGEEKTKEIIDNIIVQKGLVDVEGMSYSLMNNETYEIIKYPLCLKVCKHYSNPSDLDAIIRNIKMNGEFKCNQCNKQIKFSDMQVDILGWILTQVTKQHKIEIKNDGTNDIQWNDEQNENIVQNDINEQQIDISQYEDSGWSQ